MEMANSDCTSFPVRYFINSQEASFFSSSLLSNITRHEPETVAPYSASSFTFINVLVPTVNLSPTFSRTDETLDDEEVKTATSPFTNWFVERLLFSTPPSSYRFFHNPRNSSSFPFSTQESSVAILSLPFLLFTT